MAHRAHRRYDRVALADAGTRPSRDDGLCRVSGIGKHRWDEKIRIPKGFEISYCVLAPFDRSSVRFLESEAQRLDEQGKGR